MEAAYAFAAQNGFEWFTTTLSISPHKDSQKINAIGAELDKRTDETGEGPHFLYSDFKKDGGFQRSLVLSKEYGLYRQDYCGCEYSLAEAQKRPPKPKEESAETESGETADMELNAEQESREKAAASIFAAIPDDLPPPPSDEREERRRNKKFAGRERDKERRARKLAKKGY
jgi:predicted adenine nucleotide alpha hydrolase (AANH) superfamily ATPase